MDNLSLFTLLLACATFLLAGAASWTIWQNYKFREKERKEQLLNKIIEWAVDIIKSGYSENIDHTILGNINDEKQEYAYINNVFSILSTNFGKVKIKSISVIEDATYLDDKLLENINTLSKYLLGYTEEIDYILGTSEKEKEYSYKLKYNHPEACKEIKRRISSSREILKSQSKKMDLLAEEIIKQATNMKHSI